jgi:hypothetical protein|nr:MAG TPA: DNA binding protein [Caudoviricetes sp.]
MARMSFEEMNTRLDNRNKRETTNTHLNRVSLKNNKDHTIVRFLVDKQEDIEMYNTHMVRMTSKNGKPYPIEVSCLGDGCPLCEAAKRFMNDPFPQMVTRVNDSFYLPVVSLYNYRGEREDRYEIFSRSTNYYRTNLMGFIVRYGMENYVEIERVNGATAAQTQWNLFEARKDFEGNVLDTSESIASLRAKFNVQNDDIFGRDNSLIKNWTAEQMNQYLETGTYPSNKKEATQEVVTPRARSVNHGF